MRKQPTRSVTCKKNGNWKLLGVAILAHKKFGFILQDAEWINSKKKYLWKCSGGHVWGARTDGILDGKGCPDCYQATFLSISDRVLRKKEADRNYTSKTKEKKRKYDQIYRNKRYKEDPIYKLRIVLRARFRMALKKQRKSGSAVRNLGCSIPEFRVYLEGKFTTGMTWDNWSPKGWHIDHVKPLAGFDLSNQEELKKALHYTNLQPLWASDNLSKGARQKKP